jgi:antitoxin component of MazEF toxin-antitoxin module
MNQRYKIRTVGGAAIVTIPQSIMREMRWQAGDEVIFDVRVVAAEKSVLILPDKPVKPGPKGRGRDHGK